MEKLTARWAAFVPPARSPCLSAPDEVAIRGNTFCSLLWVRTRDRGFEPGALTHSTTVVISSNTCLGEIFTSHVLVYVSAGVYVWVSVCLWVWVRAYELAIIYYYLRSISMFVSACAYLFMCVSVNVCVCERFVAALVCICVCCVCEWCFVIIVIARHTHTRAGCSGRE